MSSAEIKSKPCTTAQRISGIFAMFTSILAVVYISIWMKGADTAKGYLGGLDWKELIFNWHPILMTSGFIMAFIWAALSFRIFKFGKPTNKLLHIFFHSGAVICFSVGLYAVFTGNNNIDKNSSHTFYPNLYSIHSWIGIGLISLYCLNFILSILIFVWNIFGDRGKSLFFEYHISMGIILIVISGIVSLSGLADLSTPFCSYTVTAPDTNPIEHFKDLSRGCKTANTAGLFIVLTIIFALYAIVDIRMPSTVTTTTNTATNSGSYGTEELHKLLI